MGSSRSRRAIALLVLVASLTLAGCGGTTPTIYSAARSDASGVELLAAFRAAIHEVPAHYWSSSTTSSGPDPVETKPLDASVCTSSKWAGLTTHDVGTGPAVFAVAGNIDAEASIVAVAAAWKRLGLTVTTSTTDDGHLLVGRGKGVSIRWDTTNRTAAHRAGGVLEGSGLCKAF